MGNARRQNLPQHVEDGGLQCRCGQLAQAGARARGLGAAVGRRPGPIDWGGADDRLGRAAKGRPK
eukprot:7322129-Lingulodinium_polyedra.AAC.1